MHSNILLSFPLSSVPCIYYVQDNVGTMNAYTAPTRGADIVITLDCTSWTNIPSFSESPTLPTGAFGKKVCTGDANRVCPGHSGRIKGSDCCDYCTDAYGKLVGCFTTFELDRNDMFITSLYNVNASSQATLPSITGKPGSLGGKNLSFTGANTGFQRVIFYGCEEVSSKTPIVNIPLRIVSSARGIFSTPKSVATVQIGLSTILSTVIPPLDPKDVDPILQNNQDGLPATFAKCFACLMAAKGKGDDAFFRTDPECTSCYDEYCWNKDPAP